MAEVNEMGGLLTTDEWLSYARQARDLGMLYPLLTGGEPFLRDDLQELLAKMQEMGLQVSINSNGTLIGENTAKWLSRHKPTRINITIYGASEESYQKLCGDGGAYERLLRAVSLLKQYEVPVKFNTSITPYNIEDLDAMIAYAKSVGSPIQDATYMFPPVQPRRRYDRAERPPFSGKGCFCKSKGGFSAKRAFLVFGTGISLFPLSHADGRNACKAGCRRRT